MVETELEHIHRLELEIVELKVRQESSALALERQAAEYARRLGDLNHAHEQQIERNAEYVSKAIFELQILGATTRISSLEKWMWFSNGASGLIGGIIGFLLSYLIRH